jgi:hypothetical protein
MEDALNTFKTRLNQIISTEGDNVRELAEKESSNIISQAREEYKRRVIRFMSKEVENVRNQRRKSLKR